MNALKIKKAGKHRLSHRVMPAVIDGDDKSNVLTSAPEVRIGARECVSSTFLMGIPSANLARLWGQSCALAYRRRLFCGAQRLLLVRNRSFESIHLKGLPRLLGENMPGTSLFALLDDIAVVLDDVALMTKVAAKKTAGVLGDDLALNAQQVSGVRAERELPVVWAVFKGSAFNKLILVPSALLVSAFIPWLITPLLMLGGMYLCFEGVEKIWHIYAHSDEVLKEKKDLHSAFRNADVDLVAFEQDKIKGAIRTDFILSAEIIVIALGTVIDADLTVQVATVALIAIAMTIGVYGLVAFIVKLDDIGIYMRRDCTDNQQENIRQRVGAMILVCCPWLMKALSFVGTLAMFLVGGGILVHGVPILHQFAEHTIAGMSAFGVVKSGLAVLLNFIVGLFSGICALLVVRLLQSCFSKNKN